MEQVDLGESIQTKDFGAEISSDTNANCLDKLAEIFKAKEIRNFIGSHPIPVALDTVNNLLEKDYLVCEKSDGIRVMLFVFNSQIYLYDRKNKFYLTDLIFKTKYVFLMDGEIYKERDIFVYSIFDALIYDSKPIISANLYTRLGYCNGFQNIVNAGFIKRNIHSKFNKFSIIAKPMYKSYAFPEVLKDVPNLKHENDGLIFTPVNSPYILGARSDILKWKPPNLNTVDFLITATNVSSIYKLQCTVTKEQIYLIEGKKSFDMLADFDYYFVEKDTSGLDGKIGEFAYDSELDVLDLSDLSIKKGGWILHRLRLDKSEPNNIKVVIDTVDSIKDCISEEELVKYKDRIRDSFKKRAEIAERF